MEEKNKTTVSVVIPNFNYAKYLDETLHSILNQEGEFELDVIVIDGGSTDNSVDILKRYGKQIRWISEKDKGQSDAINKGLRMAKGNILAYINSDDLYEQGAVQAVVDFFSRNPEAKWVYGKCRIVDKNGKEIRKFVKWYKHLIGRRYSYAKLLTENFIAQPTVFFKRGILENIGYFNVTGHLALDYEYWLRIGRQYPAAFINKYLARFRFHSISKSSIMFQRQFKEELEAAKKYADGRYKFSIFLHHVNYFKIVFCYNIMRILGL